MYKLQDEVHQTSDPFIIYENYKKMRLLLHGVVYEKSLEKLDEILKVKVFQLYIIIVHGCLVYRTSLPLMLHLCLLQFIKL